MNAASTTLAVDLGKTSCRVRVSTGSVVVSAFDGAGAPGLADDDGVDLAFRAILGAVAGLGAGLGAGLAGISQFGVGAAGVEAAPEAARRLLWLVRERFGVPVAMISDGLAAHLGAFDGGPGTVLIAGTGAVVFSVDAQGVRQVDGNGPWLGDDGSGRWIGQQGLRAVLRAHDGRGPATLLTGEAARLAGSVEALPGWVSAAGTPARTLASFAPVVLNFASAGDAVAMAIVEEACQLLAASCAAAGSLSVCAVGGLTAHPYFLERLASGLTLVPPLGDALSGAALIAGRRDLLHEERTIRG
ncbi:N-acetylglucosamine kinase [Cryobacterium sp. Y62]|uniref:N-acetylglucosamine kinase n=1 Tax=Cryobacterium sp. Y62 TaxID=2048284 RepID=UPI001304EED3|nr:BadF/BadG/BcrA/BcrD ATPase family protein [Cryobacterium sp. Y62]